MVNQPALFETTVLIDFLKGYAAAHQIMLDYRDRSISVITWIEAMAGASQESEPIARAVLNQFTELPLTADVAARAVDVRRNQHLKLPDAIILATAEASGRILVTRKTRDFSSSDPRVRVYTI